MRSPSLRALVLAAFASSISACATPSNEAGADDAITSADAKILDFTFEADLIAPANVESKKAIVSQLMYAQGILTTARHGNGQVGNVTLLEVNEREEDGTRRIHYKASLPVAWPKAIATPTSYELSLPIDATAFDAFNAKYDRACGTNEYGQETFWHDWNPKARGCVVDPADVTKSFAGVAPHAHATSDAYPEYDQIWKDDRLDVVAIFGIISADEPLDWGYTEAALFAERAKLRLSAPTVAKQEGSASILKDTTILGKAVVGGRERDVKVDVLVVNELQYVGADFDARYDALSEAADMIMYNGHAGLGKNVNALARKGKVAAGKYQLVLLNGCQSFAYIDTTLTDRRREVNGAASDPKGTKYLDVMGNALPGYANNLASMSSALYDAAIASDTPTGYVTLMSGMPSSHIVAVFGEEDNTFTP